MPRKKYTWAQTGKLSDVKVKPLTAAERQKKANIEADRLMAKRREARKPTTPTPLTPQQKRSKEAEKRRGRLIPPSSTPFGRLAEEMKKARQPKKKRRKR